MAVPVATIVKKVATTLLFSDKETSGKILVAIGSVVVGIFTPLLLLVATFTAGFDADSVTSNVQNSIDSSAISQGITSSVTSTIIDSSFFADTSTKNNYDLVMWAWMAYSNNWGYVWGTYGNILTNSSLDSLALLYPDHVGGEDYYDYIHSNYIGRRTVDCAGLIKSYMWYDFQEGRFIYGSNNFLDYNTERMIQAATVKGPIRTMPDVPGVIVYHKNHVGVYVGNGQVIEAMGTHYGVVITNLEGSGWTDWFYVPGLNYL